jgi:ElaB/YqjD/DUF883 family membrane-anchored ribosome-binding protein
METTFESGNADSRNTKQRMKSELAEGAHAAQAAASAELKNFVADIEDVIKRVANVSDADVARIRTKIQAALTSTKDGIFTSAASAKQQAQQVARYADDYVHESPWQAIGVGAAVAAVLGLTVGLLTMRRH